MWVWVAEADRESFHVRRKGSDEPLLCDEPSRVWAPLDHVQPADRADTSGSLPSFPHRVPNGQEGAKVLQQHVVVEELLRIGSILVPLAETFVVSREPANGARHGLIRKRNFCRRAEMLGCI